MKIVYKIKTYSTSGHTKDISARLLTKMEYVKIPTNIILRDAEMINNGTMFISFVVKYNNQDVIIRSQDCIIQD